MQEDGDISDEGSGGVDAAMAAAMGFSTFGAQDRPAKKRRYNPNADNAVVAGSPGLPPKPPKPHGGSGTGANRLPLLPRPAKAAATAVVKNADEVDLDGLDDDDDDDGDDVDGGGDLEETAGPPRVGHEGNSTGKQLLDEAEGKVAGDDDDDDDPEPKYIDTSQSPTRTGFDETHTAGLSVLYPAQGLPPAPGHDWGSRGRGGDRGGRARGRGGRGGHGSSSGNPGHLWWEDYYDPAFNENPWERLEQAKGLRPLGSWLTRADRPSR